MLPADRFEAFESAGITVDSGVKDAQGDRLPLKGLDLDRSAAWPADGALPEDAVLCFSNVTETGVEYPRAFVAFRDFA